MDGSAWFLLCWLILFLIGHYLYKDIDKDE